MDVRWTASVKRWDAPVGLRRQSGTVTLTVHIGDFTRDVFSQPIFGDLDAYDEGIAIVEIMRWFQTRASRSAVFDLGVAS